MLNCYTPRAASLERGDVNNGSSSRDGKGEEMDVDERNENVKVTNDKSAANDVPNADITCIKHVRRDGRAPYDMRQVRMCCCVCVCVFIESHTLLQ